MKKTASLTTRTALVLDLTRDGIACESCEISDSSIEEMIPHLRLALPNLHRVYPLNSLRRVDELQKLLHQSDPAPTVAVLGLLEDPFYPFEGKFHQALKLIELLAKSNLERIVIQTRSPLAVLAMPALRALGDRVLVKVAIEAISDAANKRFTPCLPAPSERIKLLRALRNLGVPTALQFAPLVERGGTASDRARIEEMIVGYEKTLSLVKFDELVKFSGREAITLHPKRSERYRNIVQRSELYRRQLHNQYLHVDERVSQQH